MLCRHAGCSKTLTASQNEKGGYYCSAAHRTAAGRADKAAREVAIRVDGLTAARSLTVAALLRDEVAVLAALAVIERVLRPAV